jgi:hypothetical protein
MRPDSRTIWRPSRSAVPAMYFAVRIVVIMKCKREVQRRLSWISFVINSFDAEIACAYSVFQHGMKAEYIGYT